MDVCCYQFSVCLQLTYVFPPSPTLTTESPAEIAPRNQSSMSSNMSAIKLKCSLAYFKCRLRNAKTKKCNQKSSKIRHTSYLRKNFRRWIEPKCFCNMLLPYKNWAQYPKVLAYTGKSCIRILIIKNCKPKKYIKKRKK